VTTLFVARKTKFLPAYFFLFCAKQVGLLLLGGVRVSLHRNLKKLSEIGINRDRCSIEDKRRIKVGFAKTAKNACIPSLKRKT